MRTKRRAAPVRMDPDLAERVATAPAGGDWTIRALASVRGAGATTVGRIGSFAVTIALALLASIPFVYLAGSDLPTTIDALVAGSWGSGTSISETLVQAIPLLITGLAVAIAFQAGLFNIGAEGQLVIGGLAAGIVGASVRMPGPLLCVACLLSGALAGALWALVPALLKAYRGVHEVVTTIMLNYVAFDVSRYLVSPSGPFVSATQPSATDKIPLDARLGVIAPGTRLHAGLLIALALVAVLAWLLYRTPAGFRLRLVGINPRAAATLGISVPRTTIAAMLASGGIAGLAGAVQVLGVYGRYYDSFSPGYGYDAIAVALLGALAPVGIAVAALFFGTLGAGAVQLQAVAGISREMVSVVSGLVVAFVAAQPAVLRGLRKARAFRGSATRRGVLDEALPPPLLDEHASMSAGLDAEARG
jgi:simple sugar transport system permease protein